MACAVSGAMAPDKIDWSAAAGITACGISVNAAHRSVSAD